MKCPIDGGVLGHLQVDMKFLADIHLDVCKQCQGLWLDAGELGRLTSHFSSDYQKTYTQWLSATSDGMTEPKDFWQESEKRCPKDNALMRRHYLGSVHKVGVDYCLQCQGFWFDGSELYAVAKASEPNVPLDNAIGAAVGGMYKELSKDYNKDDVVWWDFYKRPSTAIPYIASSLFNLMTAFIMRR